MWNGAVSPIHPLPSWCAHLIFFLYIHGAIYRDLFKIIVENKPKSVVHMNHSVVSCNKTFIFQLIEWV
jgi:hypothetical protein